jgi:putative redox protein
LAAAARVLNTFSSASKLKLGENVVDLKQSLLKKTQKKLSDGSAKNPIKVSIKSENQGGFQTKILIRDHEIISDQPFGFNGQDKGPKPSELVLAALAACQETTYRIFAEDMGIHIGKISVQLWGTQDLRGFMALDDETPAGFSSIEGKVLIQSDASDKDLELLKRRVDQHCPVLDDLKRPLEVRFSIEKHSA